MKKLVAAFILSTASLPLAAADFEPPLSSERIAQLASGPMSLVHAGNFEKAAALVETRLVQAGTARVRADLLEAFGVSLYNEGQIAGNDAMMRQSVPYMKRAIDAYRAAGPSSLPDLAMALASYADVERGLNPNDILDSAIAAYREAIEANRRSVGPLAAETLSNTAMLVEAETSGDRLQRDEGAGRRAVILLRDTLGATDGKSEAPMINTRLSIYEQLIRLQLRMGDLDHAQQSLRDLSGDEVLSLAPAACFRYLAIADEVARAGDGHDRMPLDPSKRPTACTAVNGAE